MTLTPSAFIVFCALSLSCAVPFSDASSGSQIGGELGWRFEYDELDHLSKIIDPAGRVTQMGYSFDEAKRLRRLMRTRADGSKVVEEFDDMGRRSTMTDGVGTVSYGYDALGRLDHIKRMESAQVRYTYDTMDRIVRLQVGDFYSVDYIYDFLGRLDSMQTPAGGIKYEYLTGQGKLVRLLPNGVRSTFEYEPNGELRRITHGVFRNPQDSNYEILTEYAYQYRPDGLIESIIEQLGGAQLVRTYRYDSVGRLIDANGGQGKRHTYEYDQLGNRTKASGFHASPQICSYDWAGRMNGLDGNQCQHDAAGNLTTVIIDGTSMNYRYNFDNQLAEVQGGKVVYQYDGEGKLIARKTRDTETTFIPDPVSPYWQPLVMEDTGGHRTLVVWEGTTPLLMIRDGRPEYFLHDHLGSVRLITDAQGNLVHHFDYDPFGGILDPPLPVDFAPRFAGLFWDPEAHAYLTRTRSYLPQMGRFMQLDPQHRVPFGSQKDLAFYAYCGDDPVNFVDRDGAEPVSLNAHEAWWDAFWRTLTGDTVLNTDPTERNTVISEVVSNAWRKARVDLMHEGRPVSPTELVVRADQIINAWRYHPHSYMEDYRGSTMPTEHEWQSAENYMYKRKAITTGEAHNVFRGSLAAKPGRAAAEFLDMQGIGWNLARMVGERTYVKGEDRFRISPDTFFVLLKKDMAWTEKWDTVTNIWKGMQRSDKWLSQTPRTIQWHRRAREDALGLMDARTALQSHNNYSYGWTNMPLPPEVLLAKPKPPHRTKLERPGNNYAAIFPPPPFRFDGSSSDHTPGGNPGSGWAGSSLLSPTSPTSVGGVYLAGTGDSLAGVGFLAGVALDSNSNLVLISNAGQEIKLPPLRLDDVVTVFRSVYLGRGPLVSIDPNPENPEGSAMIIRHDKETEGTYVGWILYQADRLMKGYSLGVDNITTQQVVSAVPEYANVLDTIYFGGESPEKRRKEHHWERFWIVPAEVQRFSSVDRNGLTLFDVPLKVKTQKMKWEKGKLVDDPLGKSSPGALAFTKWFKAQYDLIASERFLSPPSESGIPGAVSVFSELRRVALITAIAEKLRDHGVPMPFWMRDYEVRRVPFERFTPGLEVTRSNQRVTARIYGGVELSSTDKDVRDYTTATDLFRLPKVEQSSVQEKIKLVGSLDRAIRADMTSTEPLKVRQYTHQGAKYQTFSLPGAESQALAPCRLEEVDLSVPVDGGDPIQLVRSYNSFFNPRGPWGRGWAMDLPRLEETNLPVSRQGNGVQYQTAYELITPLNSMYVRFFRIEEVPVLNHSRLQVPDQTCEFWGLADANPEFLSGPTHKLLRKDGGAWHFSKSGDLVATEQGGFRTVYERDEKGRLIRILGLRGLRTVSFIELSYEATGRLVTAKAGGAPQDTTVRYEYDDVGRLARMVSGARSLSYRYDGSWITAISYRENGKDEKKAGEVSLRRFEYNARGQLIAEYDADGVRTEYHVTADSNGSTLAVKHPGSNNEMASIRFDLAFRPMEAKHPDGTRVSWSYHVNGDRLLDIMEPNGSAINFRESADRLHRRVDLGKQNQINAEYDTGGKLTTLTENGHTLLRQEWSPTGQLTLSKNGFCAAHMEYGSDGLLSRLVVAPLGEHGPFKHWRETKLDAAGRPLEITDSRGLHDSIAYDPTGGIAAMVTYRDGKSYGFRVVRDTSGRLQGIDSSWGSQHFTYDSAGLPVKLEIEIGGQKASAEWEAGLLHKLTQFDGGDYMFNYHQDGRYAQLPKQITTPNRLLLTYHYDDSILKQIRCGNAYRVNYEFDDRRRLKRLCIAPVQLGEIK